MLLIEACSWAVYGDKAPRRQRPAVWRRGIWMMRGKINTPMLGKAINASARFAAIVENA
jgi:hypothetical protein